MKQKKRHITTLLVLIWSFCFAQQYTNYSTKEGLPSNHVYTILQDAKGFMWFLTDKGMVKCNGKTFKTFTTKEGLPNNDVWEAFTTPNGKIWYLSKSSRLGYIEKDSVFSFPNKDKNKIINPIYSSQVGDSIYPTESLKTYTLKNNLWHGEQHKKNKNLNEDWIKLQHKTIRYLSLNPEDEFLSLYDKDLSITKRMPTKDLYGLTGTRGQINDSLFFWTTEKKYTILNLNTQKLKQVYFDNTQKSVPRLNLVNKEIQISGNNFVAKLNNEFNIVDPFYFPEEIEAHFGFIDKSNIIWLASFNNGIYKLPKTRSNIVYAFKNNKIQSFNYIDNKLVVGVYNKGFYSYNAQHNNFKLLMTSNEYLFGAYQIPQINTTFYSTRTVLHQSLGDKKKPIDFKKITNQNIFLNEIARKIIYFNNKLYGNFSFGINKLNAKTLVLENEYLQKGCNDILVFNNQLLIATTNGVKELKNDTIVDIFFKDNTLRKSILSLKKINDSQLLINTDGFGSYITDLKTITPLKGSKFLIVQDAFVNNNSLWLATNTGVLHFKKNNENYQLSRTYTINDGLPSNNVNTVYANTENLIVGTNNGLAILPINQKKEDLLLDLFIENVTYNNDPISDNKKRFYKSNNTLDIVVNAIDFSEAEAHTFSYKLEPVQTHWTETTTNLITFNNLPPNDYIFNLKSGTIHKHLEFSIHPLWWQNTWAKTLIGLFGIALVSIVVWRTSKKAQAKRNIKLIQEKQMSEIQLKALRSQMNPHFVFNSLAAIQYYINNNEIEASEAYLIKFSKLIRQFFELSKETEISLEQEVKLIKNYLEIEKLRFKDKFEFKIYIDSKLNKTGTPLPTMLLQPIVENAVNHGIFNKVENGTISINFYYKSEKSFKVEIIDDGVGFINTKKKSKGKVKSSNVLEDRLKFLNQSGIWKISYSEDELYPNLQDRGSKSTFIITQL
ncbi:histidine kinase [Lacinutrix salivirga]